MSSRSARPTQGRPADNNAQRNALTRTWGGRIRSAALLFTALALLAGCRETRSPLPEPSSIESLCLGAPLHAQRIFKLPGIGNTPSNQMFKSGDLHVDVDALGRIAASPKRELAEPGSDEDAVRLYVTDNGGGVMVWWRDDPVTLRYAPADPKIQLAKAQVFGAAVANIAGSDYGRVIYLLERPAGSSQIPAWRAFNVQDDEHVCS
jgi:hypothetical protein